MRREAWEMKYDDALSIAFQDTTSDQYKNEDEFRNQMYAEFIENINEVGILRFENQKWGIV